MIELEYNGFIGITCGQRKDGSRAVLWSDNQVEWFDKDEFENVLQASSFAGAVRAELCSDTFLSTHSILAEVSA
jgi:hypothetical protein